MFAPLFAQLVSFSSTISFTLPCSHSPKPHTADSRSHTERLLSRGYFDVHSVLDRAFKSLSQVYYVIVISSSPSALRIILVS